MMKRVLIVHPQGRMMRHIETAFSMAGFDVFNVQNRDDALVDVYRFVPDLVIMANDFPDGPKLFERIVGIPRIPVFVICLQGIERAGPAILDLGADHYADETVNPIGLVARANALLRRFDAARRDDLSLYPETNEVSIDGKTTHLTPTEFRLFACLSLNEARFLEYSQLIADVWGSTPVSMETLRSHIRHLKSKLNLGARGDYRLAESRGKGFCFYRSGAAHAGTDSLNLSAA